MKTYGQICGIAKALDLIGDRWTLLILRDLLLGPLRYGELLESLSGLTTNLLAERLKRLAENGLIERSGTGRESAYALTGKGASVEPVLFALGRWGLQHGDPPGKNDRGQLRWAMTALKRRLRPQNRNFVLEVTPHDAEPFTVWEKAGKVGVAAGKAAGADVVVHGSSAAIVSALVGTSKPGRAGLDVEGDRAVWTALLANLAD